MKYILTIFGAAALLFSCSSGSNEPSGTSEDGYAIYGDSISSENAIDISELATKMDGNAELNIKVKGKVTDVCKKKGCWMTIDDGGEGMMVRFKDYGFFMPLDCEGKEVIFEGMAKLDTMSVADQKHYAEDAGDSQEEIDAITEPKITIGFMADGVLMK